MVKLLAALVALSAVLLALTPADPPADPADEIRPANEPVRHVVVFKYKPDATDAQIKVVTDAFRALQDEIPGILSFEYGVNNSPEGKNQGFTHVYLMTFENVAARDAYLPHPNHEKFGTVLRGQGILDDVFVVDYVPHD